VVNRKAIIDSASTVLNTVPEVYSDLAKPTACETGKFLGRILRAINAALAPLDIWITKREYNLEKTKKLLAAELADVEPAKIVPPEAYVAVPAIQSIAYSMDSDELRSMYAKLLAKAMNMDFKDQVHPAFVEIIKQMSPLDAENLKYIAKVSETSIGEYRVYHLENKNALRGHAEPEDYFDDYEDYEDLEYDIILTNVFLANPNQKDLKMQSASISSLQRLGLAHITYIARTGEDYTPFMQTEEYINIKKNLGENRDIQIERGIVMLTPIGNLFCDICEK